MSGGELDEKLTEVSPLRLTEVSFFLNLPDLTWNEDFILFFFGNSCNVIG